MAHPQQIAFCESAKRAFPDFFRDKFVVDIGSLDINGNNQYLFDSCLYLGVDVGLGRNVDICSKGHELNLPDCSVDVVVSTECFEHDQYYVLTINNIVRMLKPGGLFVFTCATTGRPEHGTRRTTPADAPLIQSVDEWSDYYKNLEESDIRAFLDLDTIFSEYQFSIGEETHDLYFWGIKTGSSVRRHDYSFQLRKDVMAERIDGFISTISERDRSISKLMDESLELTSKFTVLSWENDRLKGELQTAGENIVSLQYDLGQMREREERNGAMLSKTLDVNDSLRNELRDLHDLRVELESALESLNRRSEALTEAVERGEYLSKELLAVYGSKSWKYSAWARGGVSFARVGVSRGKRIYGAAQRVGRIAREKPFAIKKGIRYLLTNGLSQTILRTKEVVRAEENAGFVPSPVTHAFDLRAAGKAVVLTTPHCLYVAELISACLEAVEVRCEIIFARPEGGFSDVPHFVICPQMFSELPGLYVAFQMEQSVSSRWFTSDYIKCLENSFAIFDYSLVNVDFLQKKGLSMRQMYYLPISFGNRLQKAVFRDVEKEYDVLFYGDVNNERRQRYLRALQQKFSVKIVSDSFGEELRQELLKAKVIVNIHYYEGALLETTRIYECLSYGCCVVSETSCDIDEHVELEGLVDFVGVGDIDAMTERVRHWVDNANELDVLRGRVLNSGNGACTKFNYYFYRFLLATDNLDFDRFYNLAGSYVRFSKPFVCLGLPESVERHADFEKDNRYGIEYFPGLRHSLGWIGCGLSYKFIIKKAKELGFESIVACEDDVEFYPGWEARFEQIRTVLEGGGRGLGCLFGAYRQSTYGCRNRRCERCGRC